MTRKTEMRANGCLLLTALIWGFSFASQRIAAQYMTGFAFNGLRFLMGAAVLLPVMLYIGKKSGSLPHGKRQWKTALLSGISMGIILFAASGMQQIGLETTSAGKAAFITGLYVVLVPVVGIFLKKRNHPSLWAGVVFAAVGLYFICVTQEFTIMTGDLYEIGGAALWTCHILMADRFLQRMDALVLSFLQVATCGVMSLAASLLFENMSWAAFPADAVPPLIYSGIFSVGVAYTLQLIGQKSAKPAHAAILLSMEAVFATIAGFLLLGEDLGGRVYIGCALMITGMLAAQYPVLRSGHVSDRKRGTGETTTAQGSKKQTDGAMENAG